MSNKFMERAIELARKGVGKVCPNPAVGAVIVKGGVIVGEGWHVKAGEDHAEVVAIKQVMKKSGIVSTGLDPMLFANATLYVTLEPCSHNGKTPACAKAVAAAGFKKVVVGMKDPFKKVNGKGISYLKKCGIEVEVLSAASGLGREVRELNQPFIKWATSDLPYVVLKAGMSLDGKIADVGGDSKWITGELARKDARRERTLLDAVLVGSGTVKADDPNLGDNLRVVVDGKLSCSTKAQVFRDENVFVACTDRATGARKSAFAKAGIEVKSFGKDEVNLKKLLGFLGKRGVQSVFLEGGSAMHGAFVDEGLVDKVLFYVAPKILGGENSLNVIGGEGLNLKNALNLDDLHVEQVGADLKVSGVVNFY